MIDRLLQWLGTGVGLLVSGVLGGLLFGAELLAFGLRGPYWGAMISLAALLALSAFVLGLREWAKKRNIVTI